MEIKRPAYLSKLLDARGNGQAKVVTGVRRCGKSFLVFTLFKRALLERDVPADHIIEMAFDDFEGKPYRDPSVFYPFVKDKIADEQTYYLLLDEVQLLGDFVDVLNGFLHKGNVEIYVTGSNARLLSKDIATEFRGRGDEIRLAPLSFSEFMSAYAGDKREGYLEYSVYGGLPAVTLLDAPSKKSDYLRKLFDEIYLCDIVERNRIKNAGNLDELVDVLASSIGALTNPLKLSNTFKTVKHTPISPQTVSAYIEALEDSFLIEEAARYDVKGRRYIGSPQKYYFCDPGLRNARLNFRQTEETHLMENIVYNELRARGFTVDVGVVPARRRDDSGAYRRTQLEIDFVCNKGNERCYVQSAYALPTEKKLQQEQAPFAQVDDSFRKVIVSKEGVAPHYDDHGTLMMNIYDFLLDPTSLSL